MQYFGLSSKGVKSSKNEDSFVLSDGVAIDGAETFKLKPDFAKQGHLFVICDGMGGHQAGEIVSRLAVSWLWKDFYSTPDIADVEMWLKQEIVSINSRLFNLSVEHELYNGMGTTLVGVIIKNKQAFCFNVGDSRCYLVREEQIEQITEDDSEVWKLYKKKLLTKDELVKNKRGHIITQAIALAPTVEPHIYPSFKLQDGDKILLCSDGVHDVLTDFEINKIVGSESDLPAIAMKLTEEALTAGSKDDITVVIIEEGEV